MISNKTSKLLEAIDLILEVEHEYLPLTLRQIYYRLVAADVIDKTAKAYNNLGVALVNARRSGRISYDVIRDDGFNGIKHMGYEDLNDYIDSIINHTQFLTLDHQQHQPTYLIVWCEAAGMKPQLESFIAGRAIPVVSSGGFDSVTTKYNMAHYLGNIAQYKKVQVLHIGDYDYAGIQIFNSLEREVNDNTLKLYGSTINFKRIALLPEHIKQYDLPTAPSKSKLFMDETAQCEALKPAILKQLLLDELAQYIDEDIYQQSMSQQAEVRTKAMAIIKGV